MLLVQAIFFAPSKPPKSTSVETIDTDSRIATGANRIDLRLAILLSTSSIINTTQASRYWTTWIKKMRNTKMPPQNRATSTASPIIKLNMDITLTLPLHCAQKIYVAGIVQPHSSLTTNFTFTLETVGESEIQLAQTTGDTSEAATLW